MAKTAKPVQRRTLKEIVREPSTIAGVLSIAAVILTNGTSELLDPAIWAQIGAGLGLILTKEAT